MSRSRKAPTPTADWDRHEITARLRRRGLTFAELERRHGYRPCTMRMATMKPWPKVEQIIADALGLQVEDIWPTRVAERRMREAA